MVEGPLLGRRLEDNVTTTASITSIRSALGDVLFPSQADASSTTVSRLDGDTYFVNEFHAA